MDSFFALKAARLPRLKKQILGSNVRYFLYEKSDLARELRKIEPSGSKGSDFDFSRLGLTFINRDPPALT